MARNHMILIFLLIAMISSVSATNNTSTSQDIIQAIEEMRRANYFTFVMLINMAPADLIQGGITFLMPRDKTLSQTSENDVADFLLRHSIPSPLLFDHLQHFPTGSMIPASKPDVVLKVTNSGNSRFFLNNARVISPNLCTRSGSIRCHGIDQVLETTTLASDHNNASVPLPPPCQNVANPPSGLAASPPTSAAQPVSSTGGSNLIPSPSPPLTSGAHGLPVALGHAGIIGLIWLLVALKLSL